LTPVIHGGSYDRVNVAITTSYGRHKVLDVRGECIHVYFTAPDRVQGAVSIAAVTSANVAYVGTFVVIHLSPEQKAKSDEERKKFEGADYANPK
jgi:hypothetical protein